MKNIFLIFFLIFTVSSCVEVITEDPSKNKSKKTSANETKSEFDALANFTLDVSDSEFEYHSNLAETFFFTINGKGDPANNFIENQITVISFQPLQNDVERKEYSESMVDRFRNKGISISNFEKNEINLNGITAFELEVTGDFNENSVKIYQIVLGNEKCTLLYSGIAFDREFELLKQFKKIAQTISIK